MKKLMLFTVALVASLPLIVRTQNTFNTGLRIPYDPCTGCSDNNPVNPIYQATQYFNTVPTVKSDFGPRYVLRNSGAVPYDWHGGIDYSAAGGNDDRGYHLRSIVDGVVYKIGTGGVKYIVINGAEHDFGYLHIFSPGSIPRHNGDCHIVELTTSTPQNPRHGIIVPNAQGGLTLLSDCTNCTGHYYIHNGVTLNATNQVAAGSIIAALGDSGANGNAHLHLNRYESIASGIDFVNGDANMLDPLQFVEHFQPNYQITFHNNTQIVNNPANVPQGIVMKYPGTMPTKIMVRPSMQGEAENANFYTHGTLNIAEAEVLIKKQYLSDYEVIRGATYESRVSLGAITTDNITYPGYVGTTGVANKGGWNRQGIFHFAYRDATDNHGAPYTTDGGRPYDDYYFTDFISRIHKDDPMDGDEAMLSYCPMSTRYNDGRYHIKARVTDVRNGYTDSPVQNVVIDNYKPFIRELKAQIGSQVVYRRTWQCDDGAACQGMYLEQGVVQADIDRNDLLSNGMWVTVTGSEPLLGLKLNVNSLINVPHYSQTEGGRIWNFFIAPSQIPPLLTGQAVEFVCHSAYDAANNAMIGFAPSDAALACQKIPTRKDSKSWTNDKKHGSDKLHFFNINCGANRRSSPEDEPTLTIISTEEDCFGNQITWESTPVSSPGATDGAVTLHIDGGIPPYTVDWSNGASGLQLNQLAAGTYTATIRDALCCTKDVEITVCAPFTMPQPDITPPSACGAADGFIYFREGPSGGTPPYAMSWNNGASGGSLSGLATGLYIVTVTDKNGCSSVYEYPIQATGQPIVIAETQPACAATANGYAIVNAFSQGGGPFDFYWSSGQVYYDVFETELYQLPAGAYCVTVTDDVSGCSSSICFNIAGVSEQTALAIQPITAYSCPENATGEIQWQITGGVAPYQVSWNQPGFNGVFAANLAPGNYCVTVTDYCGSSTNDCAAIETDSELAFDVSPSLIQFASGSDNHDGSIALDVRPGGNYIFQWNNGAHGNTISNLAPGQYTVTVTATQTGCQIVRTYQVGDCTTAQDFDFIVTGPVLPSNGGNVIYQILVKEGNGAYSANIPDHFAVWWGSPSASPIEQGPIISLNSSYTEDWVNAFVSNGCELKVKAKPIIRCGGAYSNTNLADFFITQQDDPCEGFFDGSILLSVPHQANQAVSILFNDTYDIDLNGDYAHIGNLGAGIDYSLKITIDDCEFDFSFRLSAQAMEQVFDRYENDLCYYRETCGDTGFGDEEFQTPAFLNWFGSTGGAFSQCRTPLLCEELEVGHKNFSKRWVKSVEYENTLQQALIIEDSPYPFDYIQNLMNQFSSTGQECRRVRYCRGNLRLVGKMPLSISPGGTIIPDPSTGCSLVQCSPPASSYQVCPHDADIFGGISPLFDNCFPRSVNLYELWVNLNYLNEYIDGFAGTSLADFVATNGHLPEAKCASVVFCLRDFKFLSSNIGVINCNIPLYYCGNFVGNSCSSTPVYGATNQITGYRVLCETNTQTVGCPDNSTSIIPGFMHYNLCPDPPQPPPPPPVTPPPSVPCHTPEGVQDNMTSSPLLKTIIDPYQNEILAGFGLAQSASANNPKGLVDTETGRVFDNFDPLDIQIKKESIAHATQFVEDWDKEMAVYVQRIAENQEYKLICEDSANIWIKAIKAAGDLQLFHLSSTPDTDEIIVGGVCSGFLFYDDQFLRAAGDYSAFCIRLQQNGAVISTEFIEHINAGGTTLFSENIDGRLQVAAKYQGNLTMGGNPVQMASSDGFFSALFQNASPPALSGDYPCSGNMALRDITFSASQNNGIALAFYGDGTLQIGGQNFGAAGNRLLLASVQPGSILNWQTDIAASNLNDQKLDITFGDNGLLFTGLTFTGSLSALGHNFQSVGGEDIALLAIDTTGAVTWQYHIGTTGSENISEMMYDHELIYFGGEFSGEIGDREIGDYIFSNLVAANTRAYISSTSIASQGQAQALTGQDKVGKEALHPLNKTQGNIIVYPNPVSSLLTIRVLDSNADQLIARDMLGRPIFKEINNSGEWHIDFSPLASGLYNITICDRTGNILHNKIIIKK
jgi:hypothetical protein